MSAYCPVVISVRFVEYGPLKTVAKTGNDVVDEKNAIAAMKTVCGAPEKDVEKLVKKYKCDLHKALEHLYEERFDGFHAFVESNTAQIWQKVQCIRPSKVSNGLPEGMKNMMIFPAKEFFARCLGHTRENCLRFLQKHGPGHVVLFAYAAQASSSQQQLILAFWTMAIKLFLPTSDVIWGRLATNSGAIDLDETN